MLERRQNIAKRNPHASYSGNSAHLSFRIGLQQRITHIPKCPPAQLKRKPVEVTRSHTLSNTGLTAVTIWPWKSSQCGAWLRQVFSRKRQFWSFLSFDHNTPPCTRWQSSLHYGELTGWIIQPLKPGAPFDQNGLASRLCLSVLQQKLHIASLWGSVMAGRMIVSAQSAGRGDRKSVV